MDIFYPFEWLSEFVTFGWLGLEQHTPLGEAVAFFVYDVPKILVMLAVIVFLVAIVRSFFPASRARQLLAGRKLYAGNVGAAGLGVVTPFCSCSAVPMFIGFVEAGVPLGVTFSFLLASPMVNELAIGLLIPVFGWKVTLAYVLSGLGVSILGGIIIGKLGLERYVEEYVYAVKVGDIAEETLTWPDRLKGARDYVAEIVGKVWPWVIVAIAIGAGMHGYLPADFLARWAGEGNPFAVLVAVAVGVPLYGNAASAVPIAGVLADKGVQVGTVLAFMMAVTALSVPEMIILRKVIKPQLIATFVGISATTIVGVGFAFNVFL